MAILILLVLFLYLVKSFEKGIILTLLLSPILGIMEVFSQPISLYLQLYILMVYIIKNYRSLVYSIRKSLFFIGSFIMMCSLFLSNYFSTDKHTPTMLLMISSYLTLFILIDIFQKNKKIARYYLKVVIVLAGIMTLNGLFETIFRYNILSELFVKIGVYPDSFNFVTGVRYGLKRAQSLFDMHTSLGGFCYIVFYFLLYLRQKGNIKRISIWLLSLLLANLFFTGVRSAIIGFCIGIIPFIDLRKYKAKNFILAGLFSCLVLPFLVPYFETVIGSITQTDNISGSNTDMRTNQFDISLSYMYNSFWFGNGISYTFNIAKMYDKELYGAESAWFPLMIDQGLLGCIAYISLYISAFVYVFKKKMKSLGWCILGFLIFDTMSSIPRISLVYYFYYIVASYYILNNSKYDHSFNNNTRLQGRKVH